MKQIWHDYNGFTLFSLPVMVWISHKLTLETDASHTAGAAVCDDKCFWCNILTSGKIHIVKNFTLYFWLSLWVFWQTSELKSVLKCDNSKTVDVINSQSSKCTKFMVLFLFFILHFYSITLNYVHFLQTLFKTTSLSVT